MAGIKFNITDGLGLVSVRMRPGGYFRFKKPVSVLWDANNGTVAMYLAQMPYDEEYRAEVRNRISDNLETDFTGREQELKTILAPLIKLMPNGCYQLRYHHHSQKTYFLYQSSRDYSIIWYYNWYTVFSKPVDHTRIKEVIQEYEEYIAEAKRKSGRVQNILDFTTPSIYDWYGYFVATQPENAINEARVKYFEEELKKGRRPAAIIFSSAFEGLSPAFIFDGHHKLLAYENLGLNPSIIEIIHLAESEDEISFDEEEIRTALYPWQAESLFCDNEPAPAARPAMPLADSQSKPAKNGIIKEYHSTGELLSGIQYKDDIKDGPAMTYFGNGRLSSSCQYRDGKIQGTYKNWYGNGEIRTITEYRDDIRTGTGKCFYESGKLECLLVFNAEGVVIARTGYFESGKLRSQEEASDDGMKRKFTGWYENGNKEVEVIWEDGAAISCLNYRENGELIVW